METPQLTNEMAYEAEEDLHSRKFLTFILGDACYGLDIGDVTEIIGVQKITEMPDVPHYIRGVINLRGNVIPVMDVRARFGLECRGYDDRTCIIVINVNDTAVGLVVDTVSEVLDIPNENIQPPPSMGSLRAGAYISGLGKMENDVKVLLDAHRLLASGEEDGAELN